MWSGNDKTSSFFHISDKVIKHKVTTVIQTGDSGQWLRDSYLYNVDACQV